MKKSNNSLSLFALTWPIFIEILLYMLMGNADTFMLSQYSDHSVAAVGVSNQILSLIIVMFGFVAVGTGIVIAQYIGANNHKNANEVAYTAITVNLMFGVVLSLLLSFFGKYILKAMDLPDELMDEAISYLKIVGGFSFVQAVLMTIGNIIRSYGYTKDAMYVTIGMNILNIIGNYLFIFGPYGFPILGVDGVAISTTVSKTIGLIVIFFIFKMRVKAAVPISKAFRINKKHVKDLLSIGLPSAGEQLSYNTSQMVITFFIALLGTEAITTKIYTQNLMMFVLLAAVSIGQGNQILIGRYVGAGENNIAYKQSLKSLKIAMLISFSMATIIYFLSPYLLTIFTKNQTIVQNGSSLLLLTIILEPGRAFNLVLINALRATGDARFPVYIGILSMWGVGIPIAYFLGITLQFGLIGVWISFIVDEWLRGILMYMRWRSRVWERMVFVQKTN